MKSFTVAGTPVAGLEQLRRMVFGGLPQEATVDRSLIRSGYVQIVVDVRGTGTSQGTWGLWNSRERLDTVEVARWIRRQPFIGGKVGMAGVSYSGINQLQAAADSADRCDLPVAASADVFADFFGRGGGVSAAFLAAWLSLVNGLKMLPDLTDVARGRLDTTWLDDRTRDRTAGEACSRTCSQPHGSRSCHRRHGSSSAVTPTSVATSGRI